MSHRKRKHSSSGPIEHGKDSESSSAAHSAFFIQAYEADLVRGPRARLAAHSLEVTVISASTENTGTGAVEWKAGDGLIPWGGSSENMSGSETRGDYEIAFEDVFGNADAGLGDKKDIWVDRYDARLLLDKLPSPVPLTSSDSIPGSPASVGWSDLPSDAEDTFFFTPDEAEDFRREKRRRLMEQNRVERLQALRAEDEEESGVDTWGGSDEEPDDTHTALMRKTATHLQGSPNPAMLEMRILANHGADPRFAFLRGRWSQAWKLIKREVSAEIEKAQAATLAQMAPSGLGGLEEYGESEDDEEEKSSVRDASAITEGEDAIKAARRERAREWARKRREC